MEEAWKEFATAGERRDPGRTITPRDHSKTEPSSSVEGDLPFIHLGEKGALDTDYEVTGLLGEGGMGRVLLARQKSLGREVAIKIVKEDVGEGATLGALFEEARITGSLEHPSIVPVHALGRDVAGRPVLVMKRVEGVSFRDLVRDPTHAGWSIFPDDRLDAILEIVMAACNALHFAHARGVIHRDVKLENVMIGSFGEVYVVDWGIAIGATSAEPGKGSLVGTPTYMPPELVSADRKQMTARTDVYLLGATLHHALVGAPRHSGDNLYAVLFAAGQSEPFEYDSEIPSELATITNRATSRDPNDRFESALALRRALTEFRSHRGSIAISDEASVRLVELGTAIRAHQSERTIQALMTECRFGFLQALRSWKENPSARDGLQRCLELSIEHEIERRDIERARALEAELVAPSPTLSARIDALAEALAVDERENKRIRSVARDEDLRIGAGAQIAVLSILPAFGAGTAAYILTRHHVLGTRELLGSPALGALLLGGGAFLLRRRLQTAISRRAIAALVALPVAGIAHRAVAIAMNDRLPSIFASDLVLATTVAVVIGITVVRPVALVAIPFAIGTVAIILRPDIALPIFIGSIVSAFAMFALAWKRAVRG